MERLLGALQEDGAAAAADFAAVYETRRRYNYYGVSERVDVTHRIQYGIEEAKDGTADEEATLRREFPHVVLEYTHRDFTRISVRSRRPRPQKVGASVAKATVKFTRFMDAADTASITSDILQLLSHGYVYEGDEILEPDFNPEYLEYELDATFVKRDPTKRTMLERVTGRNKQPSDPMQRCR